MFIYILSKIWIRNLSNLIDDIQNTLAQDITQKFILEAMVIFLIVYFTLLFIEIVLVIIWKIFYNLNRQRKLGAFKDKLENRKPYIAIHNNTGQKHTVFAIDFKHAKEIISKIGDDWTVFKKDWYQD